MEKKICLECGEEFETDDVSQDICIECIDMIDNEDENELEQ